MDGAKPCSSPMISGSKPSLFKMDGVEPYSSPVISGSKPSLFDGDPLPNPFEYRSAVEALQYLI